MSLSLYGDSMTETCYRFKVRADIIEVGEIPPTYPYQLSYDEACKLEFAGVNAHAYEDDCVTETGYDLLLVHPKTGLPFWAYNIDFE